MNNRSYTEEEIAAMLERAAELQTQQSRNPLHRSLSFEELEEIAAEAGIDPANLRQAARELDSPGKVLLDKSSGTNATHNFVERTIPGPLSLDAWEDVVAELSHRFDTDLGAGMGTTYGKSSTQQIGRSVEWRHTSMSGIETRVLVRPNDDHLRIRLSQRVGLGSTTTESIMYGSFASMVIGVIGGAIAQSGPIGLAVFFVSLLATIPLVNYADKKWRGKKHRELHELGDQIAIMLSGRADAQQESVKEENETWGWEEEKTDARIDDALLDPPSKEARHRPTRRSKSRNQ